MTKQNRSLITRLFFSKHEEISPPFEKQQFDEINPTNLPMTTHDNLTRLCISNFAFPNGKSCLKVISEFTHVMLKVCVKLATTLQAQHILST